MWQITTVCSSKRQSQYSMDSFVLIGFETRHLNITNNVSFEPELPVDCSKVIWFTITAIFSSPRRVLLCIPSVCEDITSLLKQTSALIPYGKFCFNPQTARILNSHKGPNWTWEVQVLSHLYICNYQMNNIYHVWFNKYKSKSNQYKWIWVEIDCTFFIKYTKAS